MESDDTPDDLPARAAYQASCDARGVKPNWGRNGYQAQAERWRAIAAAAADPTEPPVPERKPKKALQTVSRDLHDVLVPMSQAISALARLLEIDDRDISRFTGNVKHFQRNGFPTGLHTGRGAPAVLDRDKLLQLAVCATLHRAGMMPIPAMAATSDAWHVVGPRMVECLTDEEPRPTFMALVANGMNDRAITVHDTDGMTALLQGDDVRWMTVHRLDVIATRLRDAVRAIAPC
jgi:hypothetical protein